tara:strand:+ start:949 stop:1086 length:138 start_codon:yes stop_codon:yes gene_type:complete
MNSNKSTPRTLQELKREKSKTNWGKVLSDKDSPNKEIQPTQKARG